jgi:small-conductance mechanosensitive channel
VHRVALVEGETRLWTLIVLGIAAALPLSIEAEVLGQEAPPGAGRQAETTVTTAERALDLIEDLKARRAELDALRAELKKAGDMAAAAPVRKELAERRARYRRSLASLVELVQDEADGEIAPARAAAIDLVTQDGKSMREKLDSLSLESIEYLETISKGTAEEARQSRQRFGELLLEANRLLQYFDSNIDQRSALGDDVAAVTANMKERLQTRADGLAGFLRQTKKDIDALAEKPGLDEDASAQEELVSLKNYRDVLAESQSVTVRLMDKHGMLTEIVTSHEKVLEDPAPMIRLHELGDSSMNFVVRPWSNTSDYWDVYWDVTREVKRRFDAEGISIPFPQRDVHIHHEDASRAPRDPVEVEVS